MIEKKMLEQMLADLETLNDLNSGLIDYRKESDTAKVRRIAFSQGSIDGRIRLIKQLLEEWE